MAKAGNIWYHLMATAVGIVWGVTFVSSKVLINAGMQPFSLSGEGERRLFASSLKDELLLVLLGVRPRTVLFSLVALSGVVIVVLNGRMELHLHPLGDLLILGGMYLVMKE